MRFWDFLNKKIELKITCRPLVVWYGRERQEKVADKENGDMKITCRPLIVSMSREFRNEQHRVLWHIGEMVFGQVSLSKGQGHFSEK